MEKITRTDEDGKISESWTDRSGQTILTVQINAAERYETYYIYDDRGQLCWILPPEASAASVITPELLDRYAYRYQYDRFGRQTEKQLPGCSPEYFIYDHKDRPVLSQDGNQRNAGKWGYSLYDSKNRVVESGEVVLNGKTVSQLRHEAGMSDNYTPSDSRKAFQYSIYDSYRCTSSVTPQAFVATSGYAPIYHPLITGEITAMKTRLLDMDAWQTTTLYYDDRGRVIQTVSDNRLGGLSRTDMKYNFAGHLVQQRESHDKSSGGTDVLECVNTFDMRGRLLTQRIRLNGGVAATVTCQYDALGRLTGKQYGNLGETWSYNIRGWLTGKTSTPFRMSLRYETPQGEATACYNGNISEWEWQQGASAALMYGFNYDDLNRFTGAFEKQKSGNSWAALAGHYTEQGVSYDRNGNLLSLQRTAEGGLVDNLSYTYTGNQLTSLTEHVGRTLSGDVYACSSAPTGSYSYDANGNMKTDSRNALNLSYNFLNLPSEIRSGNTLKASYTWLADGSKLGVRDGSGAYGFEYAGSLIYLKSSSGFRLSEAHFGEGFICLNENGTQEVNYFLTDHLGSCRVIADGDGTVKERNDYYPFGAKHIRSDYPQQDGNRYKYNGKEEQTTGKLGYLDYGARMYDVGLGRWLSADPVGESAPSLSLYRYGLNNPAGYADYGGLWEFSPAGGSWFTNDKSDVSRFLSMFDLETGLYGYVSEAQLAKFVSEEFSGQGGRLSSGSLLLTEICAWGDGRGHWKIPGWQIKNLEKEIDMLGSDPLNWNNMVASGSFYSYKYYREKSWEANGGGFPGIALGSYAAGIVSDFLSNSRTWVDLSRMKRYSQGYFGNQYRSGSSVKHGKQVAKWTSKSLSVLGKVLGVAGLMGTAQEHLDGKLTKYGVGYVGASDMIGISNYSLGGAWSIGTSLGKSIVESNWYFKLIHNNRIW